MEYRRRLEVEIPQDEKKVETARRGSSKRSSRYHLSQTSTRKQLIKMVEVDRVSTKEASNMLNINYSTAKSIIRLFRKTGRMINLKTQVVPGRFTLDS